MSQAFVKKCIGSGVVHLYSCWWFGCPISIRVVRSGNSACSFINDAPSYASDSDAITVFMILHALWMGPLSGGYSLSSLR